MRTLCISTATCVRPEPMGSIHDDQGWTDGLSIRTASQRTVPYVGGSFARGLDARVAVSFSKHTTGIGPGTPRTGQRCRQITGFCKITMSLPCVVSFLPETKHIVQCFSLVWFCQTSERTAIGRRGRPDEGCATAEMTAHENKRRPGLMCGRSAFFNRSHIARKNRYLELLPSSFQITIQRCCIRLLQSRMTAM